MNRQQKMSLVAISLSLLSIFQAPLFGFLATEPMKGSGADAIDAVRSAQGESLIGVHLTTGHGTSMQPTMQPGDRALCIEWVAPEIGSVVGVEGEYEGDSEVRHRVVDLNETHVVTRGDGNDYDDDPAEWKRIRCTVVYAEGAGWWP